MKITIKFLISWVLFIIGHLVSIFMDYYPFDRLHPYPVYNWLMSKSIKFQGEGKGPWRKD